ncbi:hypothetical protein BDB01DRAFT_812671 [Pilobolus umbonatus]|nr:hypothetical protein BDB01DRAFT_812671 [Pilobolus umbonatus]
MEEDYHTYINNKIQIAGILDDNDPCAWFTVSNHTRHCVVNIPDRSGKYVLIKLLRSRYDSGNIDLQYIGILGHSGARSFGKGTLL